MVSSVSSPGKAVVTPAAEARIIYVSASAGNDYNDGLSPATPVQTIARGEQLVRDSSPDWLLLKRGDRWQVGLDQWHKRGRGPEQPMIIGAYGTGPRPLMKSGTANAPELSLEYVTVIGVQFVADSRLRAAATASASRWNNAVPPAPGTVRRSGDPQAAPRPGHTTGDPISIRSVATPRSQPGQAAHRPAATQHDSDTIEWPIQIPSREETEAEPAAPAPAHHNPVFSDAAPLSEIAASIPSPAEALRPVRPQSIKIPDAAPPQVTSTDRVAMIAPLAPLSQRIASQTQSRSLLVKRIALANDDLSLTVTFTGNIAAGIDPADLLLQSSDGTTIDCTALAVACDPTGRIATWTFPGLPGKVLPAGSWQVTLRGCITDDRGQQLDGLADGIGGDDYRSPNRLVSNGVPPITARRPHIEPLPLRAAA